MRQTLEQKEVTVKALVVGLLRAARNGLLLGLAFSLIQTANGILSASFSRPVGALIIATPLAILGMYLSRDWWGPPDENRKSIDKIERAP